MNPEKIIGAIEEFAPRNLQESWDNTGLQIGFPEGADCTGALLCVDVTEDNIAEAVALGCNLVISHHPLIFKGLKSLTGQTPTERAALAAIRSGVAVYSSHTALDSTIGGVSYALAELLGAQVVRALEPAAESNPGQGLGVIAEFPAPVKAAKLLAKIKEVCGTPTVRANTAFADMVVTDTPQVSRIALCGGSGGEFIGKARAAGADVYITADVRYHDFADNRSGMGLLDIGHFESEKCAKHIFYHVLNKKFPNFAVYYSTIEQNPVQYL